MLIGSRHVVNHSRSLNVMYEEEQIKQSEHFKYLGIYIDNTLNWNRHISYRSFLGFILSLNCLTEFLPL